MGNLEFYEELKEILNKYCETNWEDDIENALDGDEVDRLTEHLRNQLHLMNGNLTVSEYLQIEIR